MTSTGVLEDLLHRTKQHEKLSSLLALVRRIDESDEETLRRLILERSAVVEAFAREGIEARLYDFQYKESFMEALDKLAPPKRGKDI